jgi:hypothetical protein
LIDYHSVTHVDLSLRGARELLVMRDDDDGRSIRIQPLEERNYLGTRFCVELAGRFIGEQQCRLVRESAGNCNALLLAS